MGLWRTGYVYGAIFPRTKIDHFQRSWSTNICLWNIRSWRQTQEKLWILGAHTSQHQAVQLKCQHIRPHPQDRQSALWREGEEDREEAKIDSGSCRKRES